MFGLKHRARSLALLAVVAVMLGLSFLPVVRAATTDEQQNTLSSEGLGLKISPPLRELEADPGDALTLNIKVTNVTKNNLIAIPTFNDLEAQVDTGLPKILLGEDEVSSYTLKSWIQPLENLRLKPSEEKTVKVTIKVPADAAPGGHYGLVRFTAVPEGTDVTGVSLSASIGTLLFVKISGDVKESAQIEEFSISRNDKKGSFFEYGPLNITERLKNTGNIHFKPSGEVIIKNFLGKQVAALPVNQEGGTVLPDSIRKFNQQLNKKRLFGKYTATLTLVYGATNQNISRTVTFWVIPYKLILAVLLAIVLVVVVWKLIKGRKKPRGSSPKDAQAVQNSYSGDQSTHEPGHTVEPGEAYNPQQQQETPRDQNPPKIQ